MVGRKRRGVREPRGIKVGNCVLYLDAPSNCSVEWLDGYYVVGPWLCDEDTGYCVRAPALCVALRVALERIRERRGVVRARLLY